MNIFILIPIIVAFVLGAYTFRLKNKPDALVNNYALISTTIISILSFICLSFCYGKGITILKLNDFVTIGFKIDGLSVVFAGVVSFLWPFATMYATKYMSHQSHIVRFFAFYTMTFATVLGIAYSANLFTLYLFYETLTFITLPLVTHKLDQRDTYAGRKYIYYSMAGAALSFCGMVIFYYYQSTLNFEHMGSIHSLNSPSVLIAYLLMFMGFGVKAGVFPMHRWLIAAGVAPVTTTALLHAVAVVKSGVFAVMRVTYYLFDPELLSGTYAQTITILVASITIVFGSAMAMKSKHLKRRFAYSTVSQLSYILLAVTAMNTFGLVAACLHLIFHALIKIVVFYTAGNVAFVADKEYVSDIVGYAKVMKYTFLTYTVSILSLIGIPPLGGFFSKFAVAEAIISSQNEIAVFGVIALVVSALLTAIYTLQLSIIGYLPFKDFDKKKYINVKEADKKMVMPMCVITATMVILSLFSNHLVQAIQNLVGGGF